MNSNSFKYIQYVQYVLNLYQYIKFLRSKHVFIFCLPKKHSRVLWLPLPVGGHTATWGHGDSLEALTTGWLHRVRAQFRYRAELQLSGTHQGRKGFSDIPFFLLRILFPVPLGQMRPVLISDHISLNSLVVHQQFVGEW